MKRYILNIHYFVFVLILLACTPANKPKMAISKFAKQSLEMNLVIQKLMAETDPHKLHQVAEGVESTRVVLCDPIGEECNLYYQLINKMVFVTNDGEISEDDKTLLQSMNNKFQIELKKSEEKLIKEWSEFAIK